MASYDIAVIGGGPGGYAAALRASALGQKVLLIEKDRLGGTCLNSGCIPTKALYHMAWLYQKIEKASDYGIETGPVNLSFEKVQERKDSIVNSLKKGLSQRFQDAKIDIAAGEGEIISPGKLAIRTDSATNNTVSCRNIILAPGSQYTVPEIEGIDCENVVFPDQLLARETIPESLVILGGGVIGMEMGSIFSAFGSKVTIVEQMPGILPEMDAEMVRRLIPFLKKQGVQLITRAQASRIERKNDILSMNISVENQNRSVESDTIVVATGRKAVLQNTALDSLGISYTGAGILVDHAMKTNIPGIYAVGDVTALGYRLANAAMHQGIIAAENAAGLHSEFRQEVIPACVFTYPELSAVGLTEDMAIEKVGRVKIGQFPLSASGRALIEDEIAGRIKIIACKETETVLGVHIMGPHASELIHEGALAVAAKTTAGEIAELLHAHPTFSESLWEAALDVHKAPLHFTSRRK